MQLKTLAPVQLDAYRLPGAASCRLVPAPSSREWMEGTSEHFANRCLPLLMANQAGWHLLSSHSFKAWWDGSPTPDGLTIVYTEGGHPYPATSLFGYGIITFQVPYLFRTSPGYNLLVRGPANDPKDSIAPLEGLVETDWSVATFTMNWKFTRPDAVVSFQRDEPICMLVPQKRAELDATIPSLHDLEEATQLREQHVAWSQSRGLLQMRRRFGGQIQPRERWQKHYFKGSSPGGASADQHETRLHLKEFTEGLPPPNLTS